MLNYTETRMNLAIARAPAGALDEVNAFYKAVSYTGTARAGDLVWAARAPEGRILGLARICPEPAGYVLLRGLYVAPDAQGNGIGTALARAALADAAGRFCYCLPFRPLEGFYARLGFRAIAASQALQAVEARWRSYLADGLDVIVMRRLPVYDC